MNKLETWIKKNISPDSIIVIIIYIAFIICTIFGIKVIQENRYQAAKEYMEYHHYREAKTILEVLGNYKDCEQLIIEIDALTENSEKQDVH